MPVAMWFIAGLLSVGLILNLITPSQLERLIWAPVSAALVASTVAVELAARRRPAFALTLLDGASYARSSVRSRYEECR